MTRQEPPGGGESLGRGVVTPSGGDPNTSGEDGLSAEDAEFLDRIARWLALRRLTVPAVVFLESSKPLSFVGSQAMFFFEPMIKIFVGGQGYTRFARILEDRANVEEFLCRIEAADHAVREERKGESQ